MSENVENKLAIRLENIGLKYGEKEVLKNVNFSLDFGECLCVLGNNGAGKSSLAKLIMKEVDKTAGKLVINGPIGYMRQNYFSNYKYPCIDIVLMGLGKSVKLFSRPSKDDHEKALKILEHLRIANLAYQDFDSLSGGQKQLVLIARLLIGGNDILILDEITSALDFSYTELILNLVNELLDLKKSIIFITHNVNQAFLLKAKILLLSGNEALNSDYKSAKEKDFENAYDVRFMRLKHRDLDILYPDFRIRGL